MRSLVLPWLHFWAFFPVSVISVCDPGLPDLGLLNLCLWPRPLPGIVYVSALPPIFLLCPLTIACVILPLSNKYILLHLDPLPLTSLYRTIVFGWFTGLEVLIETTNSWTNLTLFSLYELIILKEQVYISFIQGPDITTHAMFVVVCSFPRCFIVLTVCHICYHFSQSSVNTLQNSLNVFF